MSVLQIFEHK